MLKKHILFDLDGTLTDPGIGITNSVAYALRKFGIDERDRTKLYKFIGPPLIDSFMQYYGFSREDAVKAVAYYREYFKPTGIYENEVYNGVREMLAGLKNEGCRLYVASSKPEPFVLEILRHFDLVSFFDGVYGSTLDETRTKKDEVIAYAVEASQIDKNDAVMVGDRHHDIDGAKNNGIFSVGVLFGYGDREEHQAAGADMIAENIYELNNILRGSKK